MPTPTAPAKEFAWTVLASALRTRRTNLRLTIREAAMASGVPRTIIGRVEKGGPCSLDNALKLAHWAKISTQQLLPNKARK